MSYSGNLFDDLLGDYIIKDYFDSEDPYIEIKESSVKMSDNSHIEINDRTDDRDKQESAREIISLNSIPSPNISDGILEEFTVLMTDLNILFQSDKTMIISKNLKQIYRYFMDDIDRCKMINQSKKININIFKLLDISYRCTFGITIKKNIEFYDVIVRFNSILYLKPEIDYISYYENRPIYGDETNVENIIFYNLLKYSILPAIQKVYSPLNVKFIDDFNVNIHHLFSNNYNSCFSYYNLLYQAKNHIRQKYISLKILLGMFSYITNILSIFNFKNNTIFNKCISFILLDIVDNMNDQDKSHFIMCLNLNSSTENISYINLFVDTVYGFVFQPYKYMDIDFMNHLFETPQMRKVLNITLNKMCKSSINKIYMDDLIHKKINEYRKLFIHISEVMKQMQIPN